MNEGQCIFLINAQICVCICVWLASGCSPVIEIHNNAVLAHPKREKIRKRNQRMEVVSGCRCVVLSMFVHVYVF